MKCIFVLLLAAMVSAAFTVEVGDQELSQGSYPFGC